MMDQLPSKSLPPVPDSLRALAAKQAHAQCSAPAPVKVYMKRTGLRMRAMQEVILDRTRAFRPSTGNATADPGEWSRLLGEFDAAVQQMRRAYQAFNAGNAELRDLPERPAGSDFYQTTLPAFEAIMQEPYEQLDAALLAWETVTMKYLQMLQGAYTPAARAA